ncbi:MULTISPECIES: thioredoxin family protein [Thermococcus]|uniref:Thioredoxin n=1 Tax=Thermococcus sibiricus (strain DSM 12597 / MM 739) TaxID=604354 RepID=C6A559_THESM|nr:MULTISPECIES: thioredoxin family protein [Thermococcus]ACS90754.1 Thioredoxin [Thermococcus sibiricus MM 739]MBC7094223.1 thioredoxin family protein [Thermococcus sp.]
MIHEYDGKIDFNRGKVVLWFSIQGCPPCRLVESFMEEVSEEFSEIRFIHVGAEKWSNIVKRFEVLNVPTLVYLKDGKEVARQNLIRSKEEVLAKIEELHEC